MVTLTDHVDIPRSCLFSLVPRPHPLTRRARAGHETRSCYSLVVDRARLCTWCLAVGLPLPSDHSAKVDLEVDIELEAQSSSQTVSMACLYQKVGRLSMCG